MLSLRPDGHRRPIATRVLALVFIVVVVAASALPDRQRDPMATWRIALEKQDRQPAKILALGESTTEGQGASALENRWLNLLAAQLRSESPTDGGRAGENYIPADYRVYEPDSNWGRPYSSTGNVTPIYWGGNLGYRALAVDVDATATYALLGTSMDLWYFRCPDCGVLTYRIDGGPVVLVDTSGTYETNAQLKNISLGEPGSHSVTVSAASARVHLGGFSVFDGDRTSGIHVYDASYSGARVGTYLQDIDGFMSCVADVAPDLITIDLGGNDYFAKTEASAFREQLSSLISAIKALPKSPSILLIIPYEPVNPAAKAGDYAALSNVLQDVASSNRAHVALLDLSRPDAMGSVSNDTHHWFSSDGVHPNDAGHVRFKDLVLDAITD